MPPVPVAGFFIDTNHHMNNGKYILVAKESVPEDFASPAACGQSTDGRQCWATLLCIRCHSNFGER